MFPITNYSKYLWYCHRLPERSFFYRGKQFPVCARCSGIWVGYGVGLILGVIWPIPWYWSIVLVLPMILDGGTQALHWRHSTNELRLITGILGGIGEMIVILYALRWTMQLGYSIGQAIFQ